jgi:hypothetical protein
MADDPHTDDMQVLLRSVEADTARTSSNRNRIRRSVLAIFDDAVGAPTGSEAEVIDLVSPDDEPQRLLWRRRVIAWTAAAAAVLVVMVAVSRGGWRVDTTGPATTGGAEERRLSLDGQSLPAKLTPGPQTTDSIAGGLSFDAPQGLTVVVEEPGQLVLAVTAEPDDDAGRLVIVETEPSDWEAHLAELAEAGEVNLKELGVMVNGRATKRLDVAVTNKAIADRSCTVGEPCIRLDGWPSTGPAALRAGADNRVIEIGRTESSIVLAIESTQRFGGPLATLAAQVISTASLETE